VYPFLKTVLVYLLIVYGAKVIKKSGKRKVKSEKFSEKRASFNFFNFLNANL
jgi:hypothetical protein